MRAGLGIFFVAATAFGQTPQLPTLQVCNGTVVRAAGTVRIDSRVAAGFAGTVDVKAEITCDPHGTAYPAGTVTLAISLTDAYQGTITMTTLEQVTSTGRVTPTAYVNGRCKAGEKPIPGCRMWVTFVDNREPEAKGTPDILGFLVIDASGRRVAHGTGPLVKGDIRVGPTPN